MKVEIINGLTFKVINNMERRFLRQYKPEDDMITTEEEMELISLVFGLKGLTTEELRATRNAVVNCYSYLIKDDKQNGGGKRYDYMDAMQSVTAVIDNVMYNPNSMED